MHPSLNFEPQPEPESPRDRANRANALHSTGPRTESGKLRASQNAVTHGLTSRAPVIPGENRAAYQLHCQQFRDEYQPQTPTESHLVQDLADTAWRLNRIPHLEAELLGRHNRIMESHRALAALSTHGQRLSRQFHKTLAELRAIQADRREREASDSKTREPLAIPALPAQEPLHNGFVFSAAEVAALGLELPAGKPPRFEPTQVVACDRQFSVATAASQ